MAQNKSRLPEIVKKFEEDILREWMREQQTALRKMLVKEDELLKQCQEFLNAFARALDTEKSDDIQAAGWSTVRETLENIARGRSLQGSTPTETAIFVLSLKRPLFARLRKDVKSAEALGEEVWAATSILDKLSLYTMEVYQKSRDELIARQQQDMMELSTPVVKLWDGVLALPIIGTLDSARTQVVMEALLQRIVETGAEVAIIDITGVPTVDTLVAQHLIKTVTAARLMGADCIISGIRPQIAQTIVHLGVALNNVITKATLADAFRVAIARAGLTVVKKDARNRGAQAREELVSGSAPEERAD